MRWFLLLLTLISVASASLDISVIASVEGTVVHQNTTLTITNDGNTTMSELALLPGYETFVGGAFPDNVQTFDPIEPGETASMSFQADATGLVSRAEGHELFSVSFSAPANVNAYQFILVLPEGYLLKHSPGTPATIPDAGYTSNGRNIMVVWTGTNMTAGDSMSFMAKYEQPFGPMINLVENYVPVTDRSLFIPGIVLAFLFGYFLSAGIVSAIMRQVNRIRVNLNPDEKTVVYYLEKNGSTEQAKLMRALDFSKAKLSRLLREMESRGLVSRTPRGKTNVIALK